MLETGSRINVNPPLLLVSSCRRVTFPLKIMTHSLSLPPSFSPPPPSVFNLRKNGKINHKSPELFGAFLSSQCLPTYPLKVTRFKVTWTLKLSNLEKRFRQFLGCEGLGGLANRNAFMLLSDIIYYCLGRQWCKPLAPMRVRVCVRVAEKGWYIQKRMDDVSKRNRQNKNAFQVKSVLAFLRFGFISVAVWNSAAQWQGGTWLCCMPPTWGVAGLFGKVGGWGPIMSVSITESDPFSWRRTEDLPLLISSLLNMPVQGKQRDLPVINHSNQKLLLFWAFW